MAASHHREEDLSAHFQQLIINSTVNGEENFQGALRCKYCKREFTNLQALGGHQNIHKAEREREKQKIFSQYGLGGSSGSGSGTRAHRHNYQGPAFGSNRGFGRLGLGIHPASMIRKPHSASTAHVRFGQVAHHRSAWRPAVAYQFLPTNREQEASLAADNYINYGLGSASAPFNGNGLVSGGGRSYSFGVPAAGAGSPFQSGSTLAASQSFGHGSNYSQNPETALTEELDLELRLYFR